MIMILGLVILVARLLNQMMDLLQFRPPANDQSIPGPSSPDYAFVFSGMSLVGSSSLRLLAMLIGGAIAFAGLAVSFFVHEKKTSFSANSAGGPENSAKLTLATYSPGIVAVVIGALVIIIAVLTKATHTYVPGGESGQGVAVPQELPPRDTLDDADSGELKMLDKVHEWNDKGPVPEK
jgi:hypothetical protein